MNRFTLPIPHSEEPAQLFSHGQGRYTLVVPGYVYKQEGFLENFERLVRLNRIFYEEMLSLTRLYFLTSKKRDHLIVEDVEALIETCWDAGLQ